MEYHPIANIFPLIQGDEFDHLVHSIKTEGLLEPIVIHPDCGSIIDGRNRFRACKEAGVAVKTMEWGGDGDLLQYVVALNVTRRHLNHGTKSLIAGKLAQAKQGQRSDLKNCDPKLTSEQAGRVFGISQKSVKRAKKVLKYGIPALIDSVHSGKIQITTAALIADYSDKEQKKLLKLSPAELTANLNSEEEKVANW